MTVAEPKGKIYSPEEYLGLEIESEVRSEFRDGEIVEMTGGTPEHNEITRMLVFLLTMALRRQPYSIFMTDQRLWIPDMRRYTYPDVMVMPRPPELQPGRRDTVMNPTLITEVLSDSTKGYDRGDKFAAYRTISTFTEYLLLVSRFIRHELQLLKCFVNCDFRASLNEHCPARTADYPHPVSKPICLY